MSELPPVVPCPEWCDETFHPWEQDGDEWRRAHEGVLPFGRTTGVEIRGYSEDWWHDGVLDQAEPCAVIDGQPVSRDDLLAIAGVLR